MTLHSLLVHYTLYGISKVQYTAFFSLQFSIYIQGLVKSQNMQNKFIQKLVDCTCWLRAFVEGPPKAVGMAISKIPLETRPIICFLVTRIRIFKEIMFLNKSTPHVRLCCTSILAKKHGRVKVTEEKFTNLECIEQI